MSRPVSSRPDWRERLAGAPISWGVCEVPGWGHQLPAALVLTEMAAAGLKATEFGPDGFLPADPAARSARLAAHGLAAVGGFVPLVLHEADRDPVAELRRLLPAFTASGARMVVLAAVSGRDGYDSRPELDAAAWRTLCDNLDKAAAAAAEVGLGAALHPHVGTVVERPGEVRRVLEGCMIHMCLDTGHLLVGGAHPLDVVRSAAGRVAHVHLKDVDAEVAGRVRAGELGYADAVARGLYRPLGAGDADIAGVVSTLEGAGYAGWYVMEQDRVLPAQRTGRAGAEAAEAELTAAVRADIAAGLAHLETALS
jgi:inosose dehydratase